MLSVAVLALLLPAHVMRCDLAARLHRPAACVRRAMRASPLHLSAADGDGGGGGDLGDDLEAALRKALSDMPTQELIDSDRRLLDGLVDEAQANDLSNCSLGSAPARLRCLLRARPAALGASTLSGGRDRALSAQPLPRVLELATSKAAGFTAFCPFRPATCQRPCRRSTASWPPCR